jgi:hypothetical protein
MTDKGDDLAYLSRTTDHVANLASQLADLVGYATLACELVQNADDAKAELMTFSVLAGNSSCGRRPCQVVLSELCAATTVGAHDGVGF